MNTIPVSVLFAFFQTAEILEQYPIGDGNINDTFGVQLVTGEKRIVQRINQYVFRNPDAIAINIGIITQHLKQSTYPLQISFPIAQTNQSWLFQDENREYWRVFTLIDNAYTPSGAVTTDLANKAAEAFGQFLSGLSNLDPQLLTDTIPGFHDTTKRWTQFESVLVQAPSKRKDTVRTEIQHLYGFKPDVDQVMGLIKENILPKRVTHNDSKAGNILFDKYTHKPLAIIDLDTVMSGTILSDFGDLVRTFVPTTPEDSPTLPTLNMDIYHALETGFLRQTAGFIAPIERENLRLGAVWIAAEQALRFLTDYLNGDTYYKIAYPDHNLIRARNQLALAYGLKQVLLSN